MSQSLLWDSLVAVKENPNFQGILSWIQQILLYHCSKQHKNIQILLFIEQNLIISFCPALCLLHRVPALPFSMADVFQVLYTVLSKILNVTSDHLCCCIKNCVFDNFNLHYFVSSVIIESLHKYFSS